MAALEEYLANLNPTELKEYERLRWLVHELVPEAEDTFSYGIPTFDYKGKHLLHFGAFKDHLSLFPTSAPVEAFKDELGSYKLSRGTIQYGHDNLIPDELIKKMLRLRVESINKQ